MQSRLMHFVAVSLFAFTSSTLVHAQATRTWISGVGDDVNPCSRTAPCKTFAGAISKTAAGGEISVLDPGGYGAVTITKSITLSGEGTAASILAAGTNGIIVNAGANDVVIIRNVSINGAMTGIDGIKYLAGKALILDRVNISGFTENGVDITSSSAASLFDVFIANVGGAAVRVDGAGAQVNIDRADIAHNSTGVHTLNGGTARISNSSFANNGTAIMNDGTTISSGNNRFVGNTVSKAGQQVQIGKEE